ncbi:hypothetical protein JOC74_004209 [Bacillus capparidis]|uniref:Uncharacterized protein n=1 Tax=Bacillus capparidis TaxID=1840411 RepID=A0ABS4D237_9BACI|nr:hypothetical protein [Bacillus capparidis]
MINQAVLSYIQLNIHVTQTNVSAALSIDIFVN